MENWSASTQQGHNGMRQGRLLTGYRYATNPVASHQ